MPLRRPELGQQPGTLLADNRAPAPNRRGKVSVQGRTEKRVGYDAAADFELPAGNWPPPTAAGHPPLLAAQLALSLAAANSF
jgi:hypothetical protein